ncbi:GerAB/ArcD/ProY family transporter [Paenibacillus sp. WC2504]|uniref:GerAB/ArcD/ProY family transporter n=1 Tax=Paenibacillus sp. WC2504 TaxID=3461403 RepID=UPI0040458468
MTFSIEMAMTLLSSQSIAIQMAKQDAWMSFLLGGVFACGITFLIGALSRRYPELTFVEFSRKILGGWLGKLVVIPFLAAWIFISGTLLRQFANFIQMIMFDRTPISVLMLMMILIVISLVGLGGIEAIARCSQLVGPIILAIIIVIMCLSFNNYEWEQILPVFTDSGFQSIFQGSLAPVSVLGDTVFLLIVTKFMENSRQGTNSAVWGVAVGSFISSILTLTALSIFGPELSAKILFPTFEMMRYVSVMEFIQNVEIFSTVIWFFSVFIKLSVYLFAASYGISQLSGIKRWKHTIWIVAPVIFILAWLFPQDGLYASHIQIQFGIQYLLPTEFIGIPLLLFTVAFIRKRARL